MNSEPPQLAGVMAPGEHWACLGLGSNFDPASNLRRAIGQLRRAVTVDSISMAWQSPAVGVEGPDYINVAILVRTPRTRDWLLAKTKEIESALGRVHAPVRPALVTIDIDLLVYDHDIAEDDLWSQVYRATTVAELLPDLRCPATGESVLHAANRLAGFLPMSPRPEILARSPGTGMSRTYTSTPSRTRTP